MARERQQAVGKAHGTLYRITRHLHVAVDTLQLALAQTPLQQFQAAADTRQQVVHLMGQAASHLTDRLQPLSVAQQYLGLAHGLFTIACNVPPDSSQHRTVEAATPVEPAVMPVDMAHTCFELCRPSVVDEIDCSRFNFIPVGGMDQFQDRHILHLKLAPAQGAMPGRVGCNHPEVEAHGDHGLT
ncbi:hypothetical protein D3C81_1164450 [compost metagenome]